MKLKHFYREEWLDENEQLGYVSYKLSRLAKCSSQSQVGADEVGVHVSGSVTLSVDEINELCLVLRQAVKDHVGIKEAKPEQELADTAPQSD